MTVGEKLRQARLDAGLSQRELCGECITRNMLSQIENGVANPSMATLQYLAGALKKPVSYFLEDLQEKLCDLHSPLQTQYGLAQQWQEHPESAPELARQLPAWDGALLLRADAAISAGELHQAEMLLEVAQIHDAAAWYFVKGRLLMAKKDFHRAIDCFLQSEQGQMCPRTVYGELESCFREVGDYKAAYHYACKQRELPK